MSLINLISFIAAIITVESAGVLLAEHLAHAIKSKWHSQTLQTSALYRILIFGIVMLITSI